MKVRIRETFRNINVLTLRNIQQSFEYILQQCIDIVGGHINQLPWVSPEVFSIYNMFILIF